MISVSGKYWEEEEKNHRIIEKVKIDNNLNDLISTLIVKNNFDKEEIYSINNDIEITNPFKNNVDFLKGIKILNKSIINSERVCVIGDYDVDGCVSTSLFVKLLKLVKASYFYYIPNRFKDGYGSNPILLKKIIKKKPNLVIMVDNGSNSNKAINFLNKNKIKSIIIDHHEIYKPYPNCGSLINPKKICDYSDKSYFCSATLTYFFIDLYLKKYSIINNFHKNLSYVLMALVSDIMPIRKINRFIAQKVINNFNYFNNLIFKKIFEIKNIKKPLEIDDFSFLFGPIFNSVGRLDDANEVVKLLTINDNQTIEFLINKMIKLNDKRKIIEEKSIKKINVNKINLVNDCIILITNNYLNEGIIGIIASRFKNYFNKPCIVLTKSKNLYKGSCRSTSNFNVGTYIKQALDDKILENGGGHNLAAGFSIKKENLKLFESFINTMYKKKIAKEKNVFLTKISAVALNKEYISLTDKIKPFGEGNHKPLFKIDNIKVIKPVILNNKFISCFIKNTSGKLYPTVSFNLLESEISKNLLFNKNSMDIIVQINENFWNNKKKMQFIIIDLFLHSNKA